MDRYLLIKDDVVVNVTVWDGVSPWDPPEGVTLQLDPGGVGPRWTRQPDGTFAPPPAPQEEA